MVGPVQGEDPLAALWRTIEADVGQSSGRLRSLIALIEERIAAQVAEIVRAPRFLQLQAAWLGLQRLVAAAHGDDLARVRVLHVTKRELAEDLTPADSFEDSALFDKLYAEIALVGGEPFGALVADHAFTRHPDDLRVLAELAGIGATVFAPVIAGAGPGLLKLEDFGDLARVSEVARALTSTPEFAKWRALRDSDDARFLCLTVPRVLARREPDDATRSYAERCWMSGAFVVGEALLRAFAADGWWAALSTAAGRTVPGDLAAGGTGARRSPVEAVVTSEEAIQLDKLGFLPLFHAHGPAEPPAIGNGTVHKPKVYDRRDATASAAVGARLPCVLGMARFVHAVMAMGRERPGARDRAGAARMLNAWIAGYADAGAAAGADSGGTPAEAEPPLRSARIEIRDPPPGDGGAPLALIWLRPRLANEEPPTELRVVTRVPWLAS